MIIEKLLKNVNYENIDSGVYMHNGHYIPRVTHILSEMLHEEYLMKWANNLGLYKRCNYIKERDRAAFIGSVSHENIEKYIKQGYYELSGYELDSKANTSVNNAVESFIKWYSDVSENHKINIMGIEQTLTCDWFGGTYDMMMEIEGKVYLVDFKTSNHISYKYFLQLAAYYYILQLNNQKIDGFIILQVNKNNISYNEYVLKLDIPESKQFMDLCINTFLSLVYAYYNRLEVEKQFKVLFGGI